MLNEEPAQSQDLQMMGMLLPLGIEKGKDFKSDVAPVAFHDGPSASREEPSGLSVLMSRSSVRCRLQRIWPSMSGDRREWRSTEERLGATRRRRSAPYEDNETTTDELKMCIARRKAFDVPQRDGG
jgi:hypothetical protein